MRVIVPGILLDVKRVNVEPLDIKGLSRLSFDL